MKRSVLWFSVLALTVVLLQFPAAALAGGGRGNDLILLKRANIDTSSGTPGIAMLGEGMDTAVAQDTEYYIVQFDGRIDGAWVEDLESMGVKFFSYIPNNAYITKIKPKNLDVVMSYDHVKYVGPYTGDMKVDPALDSLSPISTLGVAQMSGVQPTVELTVKVFDGEKVKPVKNTIEALGGKAVITSDGDGLNQKWLWAEVGTDQVDDVAAIPQVEWIEKAAGMQFHNAVATGIIRAIEAQQAPYMLRGKNQTIGILDTGLDTGNLNTLHVDFIGNGDNGYPKIKSVTSYRSDNDWSDIIGHGTHVAGTMVSPTGVAPGAQLVFQAAQTYAPYLVSPPVDTIFYDAMKSGARVHNNSWGTFSAPGTYDSTSMLADSFVWEYPDFLPVFSAGNSGMDLGPNPLAGMSIPVGSDGVIDLGSISAPATAKNVLAVGASENNRSGIGNSYGYGIYSSLFPINPIRDDDPADNPEGMAAFSSRGPTSDGRIKPDVVAPGTVIVSTRSQVTPPYEYDSYTDMSGTSMAAPMATGSAALVRQFLTQAGTKKPTAALIKAMLINGAHYMSGQYGTDSFTRPDMHQGFGRVDVMNTIYPPPPRYVVYYDVSKRGIHTNDGAVYPFYIADTLEEVRITLVWTDYPASPGGSGKKLVNDLDLTVYTSESDDLTTDWRYEPIMTGNRNAPSTYDAPWDDPSSSYDYTNNIEEVRFTPTTTGPMVVSILGFNVPGGQKHMQPYALVVSGGLGNDPTEAIPPLLFSMKGNVFSKATKAGVPGVPVTISGPVFDVVTTDGFGNFSSMALLPGRYTVSTPAAIKPARKKLSKDIVNVKVKQP